MALSGRPRQTLALPRRRLHSLAMRRTLLATILLMTLGSCGRTVEPLDLAVQMTVNKTVAALGDTIKVAVVGQGANIFSISLNYGDNLSEVVSINGARTTTVNFAHVYAAIGTYTVRATVSDLSAGDKSATTDLHIQ